VARRWIRRVLSTIVKAIVGIVVVALLLVGLALLVIETGWAKNRLRALLVRQVNEYLTATLSIGRLEGSLLRGIQLGDVNLARGAQTLIHIDEIAFAYSIRELVQRGTVIREVRVVRPRIVAARQADGRWDLGTLIKREAREQERTGPSRPIEVQGIQIVDGHISLLSPFDFGAAHVPTDFERLNASFRFAYFPVRWRLEFDRVSWIGHAPNLSVKRLAGAFGRGPGGWFFEDLSVETPESAFTLSGRVNRDPPPTNLDLRVVAPRFAFQEWSGVLRGLKDIAVHAAFDTSLKGPLTALDTTLQLTGTGGSVKGHLTLDTTVPGWHGAGAVNIDRLNLARWLNREDRPSDITGHVTFDLALQLGRHFPRGVYAFNGAHAMYMNYAADNLHARGQITDASVLVSDASAVAYGANVTLSNGSIGIDAPFPFRFQGRTASVDLRRVPATVPVPHAESVLAFDYDVTGQFRDPYIAGRAVFGRSEFLGATIGSGTTGSIDTSQRLVRYEGEGDVEGLSIRRFGEGLDVRWMRDPRFAAAVSGHFRVQGAGSDSATMTLSGGGRLARAAAFKGDLSDADVTVDIAGGSLRASYDGSFSSIDPAVPFADERFAASLTGSGRMAVTAHDVLTKATTTLDDYEVRGSLGLTASTVRALHVDRGTLEASLEHSILTVTRAEMAGAQLEGTGQGTLGVGDEAETDFAYDLTRADLAQARELTGLALSGVLATKGRLTGRLASPHVAGAATVRDLDAGDLSAPMLVVDAYDVVAPSGDFARARGRIEAHGSPVTLAGQALEQAAASATIDAGTLMFEVTAVQREGRHGSVAGSVVLRSGDRAADLRDLTVTLGSEPWRLVPQATPATLTWTDVGFSVTPVEFVDGRPDERIAVSGTWRTDGTGALRVKATHVFLDTLAGAFEQPARYGGLLDMDATIRGTRAEPRINATVTVSNGRVARVTYQQLAGRVEYANRKFEVDLRLDQSPGIWVTAVGSVPQTFFTTSEPEEPVNVAIKSSGIDLGLLAGLTDVIRDVSGKLFIDVTAVGTSHDPHFEGTMTVADAAFVVAATRSAYKNGRTALIFTPDRITVDAFHLEDANGRPLEVRGSLGTHELRVGDLEIEATARRFELMRNEFGRMEVDAALRLRGRSEAPRLFGDITISSGELKVDEIVQRTLFQPYATEQTAISEVDAVAALNPWQLLGMDVSLHVPNTLRLTGENIQISPGTPVGIGDINLRALGDLYLYKDPNQPLYITGSFDRVVGTYVFQGRRFDVNPESSINFRGDLDPEIYVTVTRVISGVETRVGIYGQARKPELRLSSTPTLDESDILSLIVFNRSTNQLSSGQQQELLVRAGALAAGFFAAPIVSTIEKETGLDIIEIEPGGELGGGPKVTIGEEIAPGLVARFSRQFGTEPYDEATIEYYLSRILRLRATFSDAQSLSARSPFRRVERAGIDLLLFFSF
jgi:autotransporter translocation and assembly factor TamB